jgi:similar to stage IV sporulation protein
MFLFRFFRWLLGYVRFTAEGGFPERFINLCINNGIVIWNIKSCSGVLYANTSINGYRNIRPVAKKSGMRVRIFRRYGLPFFLHKYRKRVGLLLGLAAFLAIITLLSGMIWNIRVIGNEKVRDDIIINAFAQSGVYVGVSKKSLDSQQVEKAALNKLDSLLWVSLNIDGCTAVIEVREKIDAPPVEDDTSPSNIIAAQAGQIVVLEPYEGTAAVNVGTAVNKGDLIIGSVTENKDGTVDFQHARGYVVARVEQKIEAKQSSAEKSAVYSGVRKHFTLHFFGVNIPIGPCMEPKEKYEVYDSKTWLEIQGIKLPLSVTRRHFLIYDEKDRQMSAEQAQLRVTESFINEASAKLKAAKLLNESIELLKTDKSVAVAGHFVCNKNIGLEKPLQVEKGG